MEYTVGQAAQRLGVAPSTLRYYDKEGLLPFVERTQGGIRRFREEDFEWLAIIECLKKTGMPIKEIRRFIDWCIEGDATIDKRLALIKAQKRATLERIAQLNETLETLEYKEWYYTAAKRAGSCSVHDAMSEDEIPERFRKFRRRG